MTWLIFFVGAALACILFNTLVIVVLLKKSNVTYMDIIIVSLSISDLLQAALGYSVEIYEYYGKDISNESACTFAGFFVAFLALVSISHFVAIAIERRYIMKHPIKARIWAKRPIIALYVIIPCWLYGFLWAVFPLLGWNEYVIEKNSPHRCNVDLTNQEPVHLSYSYNLLLWCFAVPVLIISFCCQSIYSIITRMRNQSKRLGVTNHMIISRRKLKKKQTCMSIIMILTFLLAWTPYALCVFVLSANGYVPSTLHSSAAIFAKMSALYNPIIYLCFMKNFRARCKRLIGCSSNVIASGSIQKASNSQKERSSSRHASTTSCSITRQY